MLTVLRSSDRFVTNAGWLHSRHSFSFGEHDAPGRRGFRSLRVINDDVVAPGMGFGTHGHRDMEIISIVLEGALEHRDSLGHGEVLRPGEVQVMSAGRGIRHSEFNHSKTAQAHFIQVWIEPDRAGHEPGYGQKSFPDDGAPACVRRVAGGGSPEDGALRINQDAHLHLVSLSAGEAGRAGMTRRHALGPGRGAWVHVVEGPLRVNGVELASGDGGAIEQEAEVVLEALAGGSGTSGRRQALLFDLK